MPFFIYLPWIVWSGVLTLAQDSTVAPARVKARK